MSSLTTNEKQILEKLFQMSGGYVLNFSDRTFAEFFRDELRVDIYNARFNYASGSKANRMRGFWQAAEDPLVGKSVEKLNEYISTQILIGRLSRNDFPQELLDRSSKIAARLSGVVAKESTPTETEFIAREFSTLPIAKLGLDSSLVAILQQRIGEIKRCLEANAPLAAVFLCGSCLEGILLGIACERPKEFNQSASSPKTPDRKVKHFPDWSLNDFINVARELNLIGEDVKKFSHALRDFRNYIHPFEQLSSAFNPDQHTARICWQVLQAAITQLAN